MFTRRPRRLIFLPTGAYLRLKHRQQTKTYTRRWGDVTRNPVAYSAASRMNVFPPACGTPVLRVVQPNTSGEKMRRVSTLSFGGKICCSFKFYIFFVFSVFSFLLVAKKFKTPDNTSIEFQPAIQKFFPQHFPQLQLLSPRSIWRQFLRWIFPAG